MKAGYVIISPSRIEKVPDLYFYGWGIGGERVPHFGFSESSAQRFLTPESAQDFITEKLPGALERLQVGLVKP